MFNLHQYSKLENLETLEMFETFDLVEKIQRSFVRHYKEFMRGRSPDEVEREFQKKKSLFIGSSLLGDAIEPIKEKYGEPKVAFPKKIDFLLMQRNHPSAKDTSAFFMYYQGSFFIGKVLDSVFDFNEVKDFNYSIEHELQHFLMSIYGEQTLPDYARDRSKPLTLNRYYGDPWEVQSHSTEIARKALDTVIELYDFRTRKMAKTPQDAIRILDNLDRSKESFINSYVSRDVANFVSKQEAKKKESFPLDLIEKYKKATYGNFIRMIDKWIGSKKAELSEPVSSHLL